ncbi:Sulfate/thiosulfate import ATP-binding protein CysA [Leminorella richardii]|uniref:Sulfate/thiosulfate import ATP-binding protein CysA n=1 Tax=Leminorella richardii TaxID=158841 RepID=A0A2X4UNB8_9GAMM|nr:sulfate/thiosulfate ABC transporter ATP-binding protein CysA [Leminorella richardii]SQI37148.1 Sulfate/thiosulfate import ATP-binding protein CysA [Leminorella richardii]
MSIEVRGINKAFDGTQVLHNVSLDIASGDMVALLGPSGSGKTTLLRIIAGLEFQNSGGLRINGREVSRLHARDRKVGFVFQHYALFRHMTVFDNIAFGLTVLPRRERPSPQAIRQKVEGLLEKVQLSHLANRYPSQLSGGQRQRVALARALAVDPQILLLDEPFGALDAQVRKELRTWLRRLHEDLKFTSVFVTHDQEEAMEIADRIVVMSQGHIEQAGAPEEVIDEPQSRFVLEFLGEVNRIPGEVKGNHLRLGQHVWPETVSPLHQGSVDLYLRPWDVTLSAQSTADCVLPVVVVDSQPKGHYRQLTVQPLGWHDGPLSVTFNEAGAAVPQKGARYFIGARRFYLYADDRPLNASFPLAKTA